MKVGGIKTFTDALQRIDQLERQLTAAKQPPSADDVEWIVNDMGELGVRVRGRCYFCYKGESLVYETGLHDDDQPILHRNVGKREFGETVWPFDWWMARRRQNRYTTNLTYTHGLTYVFKNDPRFMWNPLPVEVSE